MFIGTRQLILPTSEGRYVLPIVTIVHIVAEGSYSRLICENGARHVVCRNLKTFETALFRMKASRFYHCHDSHIVDLLKVVKLVQQDGIRAVMTTGALVPISRRRRKGFFAALRTA